MQCLKKCEVTVNLSTLKLSDKWKKISETYFGQMFDDFVFLTSLGIVVALFSFFIDLLINRINAGWHRFITVAKATVGLTTCFNVFFYLISRFNLSALKFG
jgi:hypothetical protein